MLLTPRERLPLPITPYHAVSAMSTWQREDEIEVPTHDQRARSCQQSPPTVDTNLSLVTF